MNKLDDLGKILSLVWLFPCPWWLSFFSMSSLTSVGHIFIWEQESCIAIGLHFHQSPRAPLCHTLYDSNSTLGIWGFEVKSKTSCEENQVQTGMYVGSLEYVSLLMGRE